MTDVIDWGLFRIHTGDCAETMRGMADESVHCCVTSPPYFGLRDYGHEGQIGLEANPDAFVTKLVDVFREVRRVLRDDGTLWLNMGDSYAGSWGAQSREHAGKHAPNISALSANQVKAAAIRESGTGSLSRTPGLKSKDLIGIPWRVAFALQADGWYLRQDIIWAKPNPMPESVRDRCTKAHEYVFLLSKSERYYFDHEAIKEPAVGAIAGNKKPNRNVPGLDAHNNRSGLHAFAERQRKQRGSTPRHAGYESSDQSGLDDVGRGETRTKRSVWTVATRPFKEAHFATFPPALIEPCILAGCPVGGTVLDPFGGAGTTAMVSAQHGRVGVMCELNPAYAQMAGRRIATAVFGPTAWAAA